LQKALDIISTIPLFDGLPPDQLKALAEIVLHKHFNKGQIIFSEGDIDRTGSSGEESDNEFAAAIEETGIAYLAVSGQDAGDKESFDYNVGTSFPLIPQNF